MQASKIVEQANRRSNELVDEARGAAITEGQRLVGEARQEVSSRRLARASSCAGKSARLAVTGASKLLGREIDAKAHAELLDKLALEIERG